MENWDKRKVVLSILCGVLALALLSVGLSMLDQLHLGGTPTKTPALFVSADTPVSGAWESAWNQVFSKTTTPFTPREKIWEDVRITSDTMGVKVSLPYPTAPCPKEPYFQARYQEIQWGETFTCPKGRVRLAAVGISRWTSASQSPSKIPYAWFGPDFKPGYSVDAHVAPNLPRDIHLSSWYYIAPSVAFYFEKNASLESLCGNMRLFNSQTHSDGRACFGEEGDRLKTVSFAQVGIPTPIFHAAPVNLTLELNDEEEKVVEFAPKIGEGVRDGNFDMRLVAILDGMKRSDEFNTITKDMESVWKPEKDSKAWVFLFQPQTPPRYSIEFLDANGKRISSHSTACPANEQLLTLHTSNSDKDIAKIRMKYRLTAHYLVIHLPQLPGFPEETKSIKNLADVRIPYVRFENLQEAITSMSRCLGGSGGFGLLGFKGDMKAKEELVFTNKTVGEILQALADKIGPNTIVDWVDGRLILKRPPTFFERFMSSAERTLQTVLHAIGIR